MVRSFPPWLARASAVTVLILAAPGMAKANFFVGTSLATFGAADCSGAAVLVSNGHFGSPDVLTSTFTTGVPAAGSQPNQLAMLGLPFDVNAGAPFTVAGLTYHNGQTFTGTAAESVAVTLSLQFVAPADVPKQQLTVGFDFSLTPNVTWDPNADADTLTPRGLGRTVTFIAGDGEYTLSLLGFSSDGGRTIAPRFVLPEDQTMGSVLYATLARRPSVALVTAANPEPATLTMLAAGAVGLLGYAGLRRKRVVEDLV